MNQNRTFNSHDLTGYIREVLRTEDVFSAAFFRVTQLKHRHSHYIFVGTQGTFDDLYEPVAEWASQNGLRTGTDITFLPVEDRETRAKKLNDAMSRLAQQTEGTLASLKRKAAKLFAPQETEQEERYTLPFVSFQNSADAKKFQKDFSLLLPIVSFKGDQAELTYPENADNRPTPPVLSAPPALAYRRR